MICPRCKGNGYSEENRPAMSSSLEDSDGDMYYSGNCILCGYHKEIIEAPVCPMPPKEVTCGRKPGGGLTKIDLLVWEFRDSIKNLFGANCGIANISKLLTKARPGIGINYKKITASLERLENGQIEKKVREA